MRSLIQKGLKEALEREPGLKEVLELEKEILEVSFVDLEMVALEYPLVGKLVTAADSFAIVAERLKTLGPLP